MLRIKGLYHPLLVSDGAKSGSTLTANDVFLNTPEESANAILITGPNMGGKSTLLRQTCLAVILAQLGCNVPCKSMELTVVDKIYTRMGASDKILEGKSTFWLELEQTRTILENSTRNSLAILDELGRGTSTFDGYSIAYSVLKQLTKSTKCRVLFSTHFH